MTRLLKPALLVLVVALIAAQFFRPDRTAAPIDPSQVMTASVAVPAPVDALLHRACYDCHSNETRWPWYTQVAPVSWILAKHVRDGRDELNFSVWGSYQPRRQAHKLTEICDQVTAGSMPLRAYTVLHRDTSLSPADVEALCTWAKTAATTITP